MISEVEQVWTRYFDLTPASEEDDAKKKNAKDEDKHGEVEEEKRIKIARQR